MFVLNTNPVEWFTKGIADTKGNRPQNTTVPGNETVVLKGLINQATTAVVDRFINSTNSKLAISVISMREVTTLVNGGTTKGKILLTKAAEGTAIGSATTIKSIDVDSAVQTDTNTKTYEWAGSDTDDVEILLPGDALNLESVAATGTGGTGTVFVTVLAHEIQ